MSTVGAVEKIGMLEKIDPDGDITFIFEDSMKKTPSSLIQLKCASPIFVVISGDNFREGRMLQEVALQNSQAEPVTQRRLIPHHSRSPRCHPRPI
jgi:hypothetical protein